MSTTSSHKTLQQAVSPGGSGPVVESKILENSAVPIAASIGYSLPILRVLILSLICVLAFFVRLFAVVRFESVIHEFDPYFNFRTTKYLSQEGLYEWWNWFDRESWYPLGRVIGQTLYPGLMTTAYTMFKAFRLIGLDIDIKDVCVFTAPIFSGFTALAAYLFTKEGTRQHNAGLFASLLMALSPAYMSRSVAGSYDNEAVAIFALVFTFYAYVRALNCATALSATLAALSYFYMVASWGGYVFITNIVAVHSLALIVLGRVTSKHYLVYSVFYIIGTLLCLNIPFVNFQAIRSSEHMASHGVFIFMQALFLSRAIRRCIPTNSFKSLLKIGVGFVVGFSALFFLWLNVTGRTQWSGRSLTLLDPTYASKYIPIIASVSEHQPPTWASYIFDIHLASLLAPAGLWIVFSMSSDASLFLGLYGLLSAYFSCVMVRLMLVLSPAACILAGVGLSFALSGVVPREGDIREILFSADEGKQPDVAEIKSKASSTSDPSKPTVLKSSKNLNKDQSDPKSSMPSSAPEKGGLLIYVLVGLIITGVLYTLVVGYIRHGVFASAFAYSHPSIIMNTQLSDGSRFLQDDFREAYYWMRQNTHPDSRMMSWWDYGYQACSMGNRTVIVDNNTWNNTHIATVGLAFASTEEAAYPILLKLDVDYVFVVFGGYARYSGDDINKFIWMIRIAGGVYPWVKEADFYSHGGQYTVGDSAPKVLTESLMYQLSFYRFNKGPSKGFDSVRHEVVRSIKPLKHLEEVYTTENWMVRIYKVKPPHNRKVDTSTF